MARNREKLDYRGQSSLVLRRLKSEPPGWKKERLLAVKLGLEGKLDLDEIAEAVGRSRSTIQRWLDMYRAGGLDELLNRGKTTGAPGLLSKKAASDLKRQLKKSQWRTMNEAREWLVENHGIEASPSSMYRYLKALGGKLKVPRARHTNQDPKKTKDFKKDFYGKLVGLKIPRDQPMKIWVADEMRYGLRGFVRRVWGVRGIRPVVKTQQRYEWGYVYGALDCVQARGQFLYTPTVNLEWTEAFLTQLVRSDPQAEHIVVWDGAGFHPADPTHARIPERIHLIPLPPYSPELNPIEKLWDIVQDGLCNRVFTNLERIEEKLTERLRRYWEDPSSIGSLLGNGWLKDSVNATPGTIIPI